MSARAKLQRRVAIAAGVCGQAASLAAAHAVAPDGKALIYYAAVLAAALVPLLSGLRASALRRVLQADPPPGWLFFLFELTLVLTVATKVPAAGAPAAFLIVQGRLMMRAEVALTPWGPAVAIAQGVTAATLTPGPATLLLLVPVALLSLAAIGMASSADVRETLRKRRVRNLADERPAELRRRLAYAAPLTLAIFSLAVLFFPVAARRPFASSADRGAAGGSSLTGSGGPITTGGGGSVEQGIGFSSRLDTGGVPLPSYEVIANVEPMRDGVPLGRQGPILLRGVALGRFTEQGARMLDGGAMVRRRDDDDRLEDGWTPLVDLPAGASTVDLRVSQYPLPVEPQGWSLLLTTDRTYAVSVPDVRHDPNRLLAATNVPEDWFTYDIRVHDPLERPPSLAGAKAVHPARWPTDLPKNSAALRRLSDHARVVTSGATTDGERVERVISHFKNGYEYSLEEAGFGGVAGLAQLIDRRSGFCTHFASAATLMLRSLGIPTRVVSGFLVQEWRADEGRYLVRPRDTHAWLEVHFEDRGWVPFDPTPADPRRTEFGEGGADTAMGWAATMLDRVGRVVATAGDAAAIDALWTALRSAPNAVRIGLAALFALFVGSIFRRFARGRRARTADGATVTAAQREAADLLQRLRTILAKRGFHRPPSTTWREFGATVVHSGGVSYRPLPKIVEELYAIRFGGRPADPGLRERLRAFELSIPSPVKF